MLRLSVCGSELSEAEMGLEMGKKEMGCHEYLYSVSARPDPALRRMSMACEASPRFMEGDQSETVCKFSSMVIRVR